MNLTQYDYNRHLFLVIPTPAIRPRIPISWSNDQDRPTNITIKHMPKQYATINPLFPNILIKENGNTIRLESNYAVHKYAIKFNITIVNHTEKRGQAIINNQAK